MSTADEQTQFLRIYLDDHLAGARAGCHRAQRLAEAEAGSKDAAALASFAADVAADLRALEDVMKSMGVEANRLKTGLATLGEKLGMVKLNGRALRRSPLSTIVELEAMRMAVRGKRSLWETLRIVLAEGSPVDLEALIARADAQAGLLAGLHAERAAQTFSRTLH
jgi:hypothetical protein